MKSYQFLSKLIRPIMAGKIRQSVRRDVAEEVPEPGERFEVRMLNSNSLMATLTCKEVTPFQLHYGQQTLTMMVEGEVKTYDSKSPLVRDIAKADGYGSVKEFFDFLAKPEGFFSGVLVKW